MSSMFLALVALLMPIFGMFPTSTAHSEPVDLGGRPQQTTGIATTVVLAFDTSESMSGAKLRQVQQAARAFVERLDQNTPVAIVTFADTAQLTQEYTTDRLLLGNAINALEAGGETALYDGAQIAATLAANSPAAGRFVILITDSADEGGLSKAKREDALTIARAGNVTFFTIGLGAEADNEFLKALADGTNALHYAVPSLENLQDLRVIYTALGGQFANTPGLATAPEQPTVTPAATTDESAKPVQPTAIGTGAPAAPEVPTDLTAAVVLALDISDNTAGLQIVEMKRAARQFVENLDANVPVAVVTMGDNAVLRADFTTDKATLLSALNALDIDGRSALYAGTTLALEVAGRANVQRRVMILVSDGVNNQNTAATPETIVALAQQNSVVVNTVTMGFGSPPNSFLKDLAAATGGRNFDVLARDAARLSTLYAELGADLKSGPVTVSAVGTPGAGGPTAVAALPSAPAPVIPPLNAPEAVGTGVPGNIGELGQPGVDIPGSENVEPPTDSSGAPVIPPLNDGLPGISDPVEGSVPNPTAAPLAVGVEATAGPGLEVAAVPVNNVYPITITPAAPLDFTVAELAVNGFKLRAFTAEPFTYNLDASALRAGQYQLTFTIANQQGGIQRAAVDFEVQVEERNSAPLSATTAPGAALVPLQDPDQRVILIDGQRAPLNFRFNSDATLSLVATAEDGAPGTTEQPNTIGEILATPLSLIPAPIRDALTAQRPALWTAIILILTVILLPQGLFTLYYMMYTWNNPDIAELYAAPKQFAPPQFSFTALLPARKEKDVIYQTIRAVDNINYPDHLKEIIILIRDDDDDETIDAAKRAIADIGKPSIRLHTFTEGQKNKPNGLNRGLKIATKDVVCVFDAEDEPHPEIYDVINSVMVRDGADVVQAGVQLMNFTSTWFSALNCLEYFFWFKSGLHAFTRQFKVTPLGGNTVFIKRDWLNRVDGWDANTLTEDADLGIRLTLQGAKIQIVYDAKHATQEETPSSVEQFIKQRTRWVQGFYEIFRKGDWRKLPSLTQQLVATYILLNSLLQAGIVIFLPIGIYVALTQRLPVIVSMISYVPIFMLFTQLIVNLIGIREFCAAYGKKLPFGFTLKMIIWYYPFQLMMAWASFRAVRRFIANKSNWEKTDHSNLHRTAIAPTGPAAGATTQSTTTHN